MRLLVSGCTTTLREQCRESPEQLGALLTPSSGNSIDSIRAITDYIACDNDCFNGLNAPKFARFAETVAASDVPIKWITCPDVVANMGATLALFNEWAPMLERLRLPIALVIQDGADQYRDIVQCYYNRIKAVFIGGSTAFKLGTIAEDIMHEAKRAGKLVHVGRVNSRRRIQRFASLGCVDSIDGSGFSRWGKRIPLGVQWIRQAKQNRQTNLF